MACTEKRKPHVAESRTRKRGPKPGKRTSEPKSSAHTARYQRSNLTLADWFEVFAYIDKNPCDSQEDVIAFFRGRRTRSLIFTQSTLSRKLKRRHELQNRATQTPMAMSSKRPHAVTSPAVENALALWQKSMEDKNEIVSGPMLMAKRTWFENKFNVPENERLKGKGWVQPFLRNYQIKAIRRHGEAASVNVDNVVQEQHRVAEILSQYSPEDRFNLDETGLYAFAPPDNGLATKQMSGKKRNKFRITIAFTCNATGSQKEEPFFIGKSMMPRCFGKISPGRRGFYYRNNNSAWMTAYLFKEWLMKFDSKMRAQHRSVILLVDNFAGHIVPYQPTNVRLEFFAPNMTSFVQPLDAGIIRCFKALYRQTYCLRAIELDEAGERDIYKITLLEAMLIAKDAWQRVNAKTIRNCWKHTRIQGEASVPSTASIPAPATTLSAPLRNEAAWNIIQHFAGGDGSLPQVEAQLKECLGSQYVYDDWKPAFDAVFQAEDDTVAAVTAVNELVSHAMASTASSITTSSSKAIGIDPSLPKVDQLAVAESELMQSVDELQKHRRIIGTAPTLEDLLNPVQEQEIGENLNHFEDDNAIVAEVRRRMATTNEEPEIDSDDDDDENMDEPVSGITLQDGTDICAKLEGLCLEHSEADDVLDLTRLLRRFRGFLFQKDIRSRRQTTLNDMWGLGATTDGCV